MDIRQIALLLLSLTVTEVLGSSYETGIISKLMTGYDVNVRPSEGANSTVVLHVGLALNQIIDLDERSQILTVKVWFRHYWEDYRLQWDPKDYGGTEDVRLFGTRIWRPDITLYSDVQEEHEDRAEYYPATIRYDGHVEYLLPNIVKSYCRLNVRYFPYDAQMCELKFGSWTYDKAHLDLLLFNNSHGDISVFEDNGEWDLIDVPAKRRERRYPCCPHPFPDVTFWVILQRRPLYYIFNLILPCIFITATTVLVFYLPPESGEKVSLAVTVLLATTVFLLLVAESMPPQSEVVPLIAQYFGAVIILMAITTAFTVIVINLHHRGAQGHKVPRFVRVAILEWLAYLVCMRKMAKKITDAHKQAEKEGKISRKRQQMEAQHAINVNSVDNFKTMTPKIVTPELAGTPTTSEILLQEIVNLLRESHLHKLKEYDEENRRSDWMVVAMVIDRFLLILFSILTIVVTLALLINTPLAKNPQLPD